MTNSLSRRTAIFSAGLIKMFPPLHHDVHLRFCWPPHLEWSPVGRIDRWAQNLLFRVSISVAFWGHSRRGSRGWSVILIDCLKSYPVAGWHKLESDRFVSHAEQHYRDGGGGGLKRNGKQSSRQHHTFNCSSTKIPKRHSTCRETCVWSFYSALKCSVQPTSRFKETTTTSSNCLNGLESNTLERSRIKIFWRNGSNWPHRRPKTRDDGQFNNNLYWMMVFDRMWWRVWILGKSCSFFLFNRRRRTINFKLCQYSCLSAEYSEQWTKVFVGGTILLKMSEILFNRMSILQLQWTIHALALPLSVKYGF